MLDITNATKLVRDRKKLISNRSTCPGLVRACHQSIQTKSLCVPFYSFGPIRHAPSCTHAHTHKRSTIKNIFPDNTRQHQTYPGKRKTGRDVTHYWEPLRSKSCNASVACSPHLLPNKGPQDCPIDRVILLTRICRHHWNHSRVKLWG